MMRILHIQGDKPLAHHLDKLEHVLPLRDDGFPAPLLRMASVDFNQLAVGRYVRPATEKVRRLREEDDSAES